MATSFSNRPVEWPTIAVIAAVYLVLGLLLANHASLPWLVIMPIGAYAAALHVSLQHEVLHGHPTRNRWLNEALVFVTPTMWLPYHRYRETHLVHHNDAYLTDPHKDPESYYLLPEEWAAMPGLKRTLYTANQTLAGRMIMGPAISIIRFWGPDLRACLRGDQSKIMSWAVFAVAVLVTTSIIRWFGMPLWQYIVLIAYPGISLALVRSFCEHQAAEKFEHRTIIVEASPFWSLLFLNNNLHVAHHERPAMAWYRLPALYRSERQAMITRNNGYLMRGYSEIFRRYFLKAKEPIPYPEVRWLKP